MEVSRFPFSDAPFLLDNDIVPKSSWQMTDIQVIDHSHVQEPKSKGVISYFFSSSYQSSSICLQGFSTLISMPKCTQNYPRFSLALVTSS